MDGQLMATWLIILLSVAGTLFIVAIILLLLAIKFSKDIAYKF